MSRSHIKWIALTVFVIVMTLLPTFVILAGFAPGGSD